MRRATLVFIAALVLTAAAAQADVIVLVDGRMFEVEGPIRFQGDHVHFTLPHSGQSVTFRRFEVDENKTRAYNQVLDSDLKGLPKMRRMEAIDAQRPRIARRSTPVAESPSYEEEQEIRELAGTRVPVKYPAGDYPLSVQPRRTSVEPVGREKAEELYARGLRPAERPLTDYGDFRENQQQEASARRRAEEDAREKAQRRAEREEEMSERERERARRRAEREAAREAARAEREAEREAARAQREAERAAREAERRAARMEKLQEEADEYRDEISQYDLEIRGLRDELQRLTDLQQDAQTQFEGQRLESVDREIDRILRDIERAESRQQRWEDRLQDTLDEMAALEAEE